MYTPDGCTASIAVTKCFGYATYLDRMEALKVVIGWWELVAYKKGMNTMVEV